MIDGAPWFVAADACKCLGLAVGGATNASHHIRNLDKDERRNVTRREGGNFPPLFVGTLTTRLALISRPGLFKLIQRSSKPEAKAFDRYVRHEVLPQVMDNGGYLLNEDMRATAFADTKDEMPFPAAYHQTTHFCHF